MIFTPAPDLPRPATTSSRLLSFVVRNRAVGLIDGQQRLTTLYLIAKYMSQSNWLPRAKVNYSLLYETRENSGEYLESLDPALRHSNIDFHYIYSAYEAIGEWFDQQEAPDLAAINTWKALSERVYLIWYEAPEGTDGSELFQRLNVGRIALTDAVIKALLLSKIGVSAERNGRSKSPSSGTVTSASCATLTCGRLSPDPTPNGRRTSI